MEHALAPKYQLGCSVFTVEPVTNSDQQHIKMRPTGRIFHHGRIRQTRRSSAASLRDPIPANRCASFQPAASPRMPPHPETSADLLK